MSYQDYAERHFSKARLAAREILAPQRGRMSEENIGRAFKRLSEVLRKTGWVLKDAKGQDVKIKPSTFKVFEYLFMGAHNRKTGRCNPRNATIEKHTGLKKSSVENATSELEKVGLIRKVEYFIECQKTGRKRQRSNYYYLAKGVMKAMYLLLKAKEKTNSLFKFFLAKSVATEKRINTFFKSLDQKKTICSKSFIIK